jgi:hypothetical protein
MARSLANLARPRLNADYLSRGGQDFNPSASHRSPFGCAEATAMEYAARSGANLRTCQHGLNKNLVRFRKNIVKLIDFQN